jgi:hypothetical protein
MSKKELGTVWGGREVEKRKVREKRKREKREEKNGEREKKVE